VELQQANADSKHIRIYIDIENNSKYSLINSDEKRFQQVLLCLLTNAVKFTRKGYVKIEANFYETAEDTFLKILVKDSGIGIKPEDFNKLFKLFGFMNN
jgi:signal transduction histidine kinase